MSQWNLIEYMRNYMKEYILKQGNSWDIFYSFTIPADTTNYLVFIFDDTEEIHPSYRKIKAFTAENQTIDLNVSTLVNPTVGTLGTDISEKIINSNLNIENTFKFKMYDETSDITDDGIRIPFSSTLIADRRQADTDFIEREYIAPVNSIIALKFINNNIGASVTVEYASGGHRIKL